MPLGKRNIDDSQQTSTDLTPLTSTDSNLPGASVPLVINTDPAEPGVVTVASLIEYLQTGVTSAVGDAWLTSDAIVDGDIGESDTLNWTPATDAPTGVADGANTKCTIPRTPPTDATFGWRADLYDSSDVLVAAVSQMWGRESDDLIYYLKLDSTSYVSFKLQDVGTTTLVPTFTFTIENTDNGLTDHYITISPARLSV